MKEAVDSAAETATPFKKKRILLIEDESTTRLFLLNQLKKAGLEVDAAANGNIGLRKLKDTHFDAVLLDVMLPGLKGHDFIKEIRKKDPDLPIFVCSTAQRMDPWRRLVAKAIIAQAFDKASPADKIVGEIVNHLIPKPTAAAEPEARNEAEAAKAPPMSPLVPDTVFTQAPRAEEPKVTPVNLSAKEPAPGSQPLFTPLPSGRGDTGAASRPLTPPPPPAPPVGFVPAEPQTQSAERGKTGFFRNPDPPRTPTPTPNTALLRKAAKAGQAAQKTPVPAISGDTPLTIPPMSEAPPPPPTPPAPEVKAEPAPEAPKERATGFAERIIAPFKIFSRGDSSGDDKKVHDLKEQLAEVTRNRDELLALLRDHPIFGAAQKSEGLEEVKAAASRAEAAYQAELARSKGFEEELKRIREARDDLNKKLEREEQAAAESRRKSKELEERLAQSGSELEQVKGELQKHISEHSKLEGELRQQLNTARESADIAKVAYHEEAARAVRSTEELVSLQQAREQLNTRLSSELKAASESKSRSEQREQQLRDTAAEVERLKAELSKQAARGKAQAELTEKLNAAQVAAQNAEAACKEESARGAQFEQELARLNQAREELNGKLAREEQAAAEARRRSEEMERQLAASAAELQRVKGDLDRHADDRKALETQLQQEVAAANAAAEKARQEFQQETSIFHRSKEEVEALRQARDQLNTQLEQEQTSAAESRRHSQELENRLQESAQELQKLRSELEKHVNERASLVTTSSRQLNAAKAAAAKAEKSYQEQLKRSAKFEQDLAAIRQDRTQLAKSKRKIKELEQRAARHADELEGARKDLEKQVSERERLESEHRQFADGAQNVRAPENDPAQTEARFRESISALARATAQLEKERGERRRVEQRSAFLSGQLENLHEELRKQLAVEKESQQRVAESEQQAREREEALGKAISDLQKESATRQLVEAQLKAKGEMDSKLQDQFNLLDEAKRVFNDTQEKAEARLQAALASLKQSQAKLQKQASERQRLEDLLEDTRRKLQDQSHQRAEEIARLQSTLQLESIERRKLESQSMQSRYGSLDASRLGRAFVNSFRTHLRPSAENLVQATRRLLDLPLDDEHKKLVEDLLENALLLHTSMQDDARLPGETDPGESAKAA